MRRWRRLGGSTPEARAIFVDVSGSFLEIEHGSVGYEIGGAEESSVPQKIHRCIEQHTCEFGAFQDATSRPKYLAKGKLRDRRLPNFKGNVNEPTFTHEGFHRALTLADATLSRCCGWQLDGRQLTAPTGAPRRAWRLSNRPIAEALTRNSPLSVTQTRPGRVRSPTARCSPRRISLLHWAARVECGCECVKAGHSDHHVAAIFQKNPQILLAHPDQGIEEFDDLAELDTIFMAADGFITYFEWMKARDVGFRDEQYKPYQFQPRPLPGRHQTPRSRAT